MLNRLRPVSFSRHFYGVAIFLYEYHYFFCLNEYFWDYWIFWGGLMTHLFTQWTKLSWVTTPTTSRASKQVNSEVLATRPVVWRWFDATKNEVILCLCFRVEVQETGLQLGRWGTQPAVRNPGRSWRFHWKSENIILERKVTTKTLHDNFLVYGALIITMYMHTIWHF